MAKLVTLNLLLAAVRMRFWQNCGQTNNLQKGQKVNKLITLRHICIYIYIYMHAVELKICPKIALFWVEILSKNFSLFLFFVFFFFQNRLLSAGFPKKEKNKKIPFFASKICPTMLRNITGQIFDSTLDRFSTQQFC